jgi:hypothetical protein
MVTPITLATLLAIKLNLVVGISKVYSYVVMERNHLKDQGLDGWRGTEWILGRLAGGV